VGTVKLPKWVFAYLGIVGTIYKNVYITDCIYICSEAVEGVNMPNSKSKTKPREKPLSLYPTKPDEVLKVMLNTPPMPKERKQHRKTRTTKVGK